MSDVIKHECGLAMIRLRKPLEYYHDKYGTSLYGLYKLQLLMEKQRNRGQDGAGVATIKLRPEPGTRYISRKRNNQSQATKNLFKDIFANFENCSREELDNPNWLKQNKPFAAELLLGHLRYGTHGKNTIENVHPFLRQNNWINRNLILAGNFNLTNVDELFDELVELGQYPKEVSDTVTVLEKIGHFLDDEVQRLFSWYKPDGYTNPEINHLITEQLDIQRLLKRSTKRFDGGYVMAGLIGHGDAFVLRDPKGIRPAFYYVDDEVVVAASERPAIMTAFNVPYRNMNELTPGYALVVKADGSVEELPIREDRDIQQCTFERIYFSRGTDKNIYTERKKMGKLLAPRILDEISYDIDNTIFSFIPNTAECAFFGFVEGLNKNLDHIKAQRLQDLPAGADIKEIEHILNWQPRVEKLINKDEKLRTFIANEDHRGELVPHVYDVTYGIIKNNSDTLVLLDDSIVRGTTLRDNILRNLDRLHPKRIIIVSCAPQIRYPDCYGIDMSKMREFAAFQAMIKLLEENGKSYLLDEVYQSCKQIVEGTSSPDHNPIQQLYDLFSDQEIADKMSAMIQPEDVKAKVHIIFQTIENLHKACPHHHGDWYFTGNYPTPGGYKVVSKAFINYMEKVDVRAY